jgi:hypothetical protein
VGVRGVRLRRMGRSCRMGLAEVGLCKMTRSEVVLFFN